jgi:hypothetical protein
VITDGSWWSNSLPCLNLDLGGFELLQVGIGWRGRSDAVPVPVKRQSGRRSRSDLCGRCDLLEVLSRWLEDYRMSDDEKRDVEGDL